MQSSGNHSPSAQHCLQCRARLAHDQRYCVECGTRRGPLPAQIAQIVNQILEQGRDATQLPGGTAQTRPARPARPARPRPARPARPRRARWIDLWAPNPIGAALAVMAMLGFGVIVGDMSGAETLLSAASPNQSILVDLPPGLLPAAPNQAVASTAGRTGGGSSAAAPASSSISSSSSGKSSSASSSGGSSSRSSGAPGPLALPPVKHVFLIVLSDEGYAQTFAPVSKDKYLNAALVKQGELVDNYYAVAGSSLANEIAMVSGQGPTQDTDDDCPRYVPVRPFQRAAGSQVVGNGCIYPAATHSLAGQLTKDHATWKAYLDGLGDGPQAQLRNCGQPTIGGDEYATSTAKDPYLAWRNPFAYFAALRTRSVCRTHDVSLGALQQNLKQASTTPSLSFIVPDACDDASPQPCHPGAAAGLAPANAFLRRVLAMIKASAAYKSSGLIAITFDHAPQTGPQADPSACCSTPTYPNVAPITTPPTTTPVTTPPTTTTPVTTPPTTTTPVTTTPTTTQPYAIAPTTSMTTPTATQPYAIAPTTTPTTPTSTTPLPVTGGQTTPTGGGGQVGLLLISRYVKPGSSDLVDYFNHFSLLAGIESLFKLHQVAYAGTPSLPRFPVELYDYHGPS
jgi:hypothetical protein